MFYALAEGLVATGDRRYVHELADIETLNRRALAGELEVSAVSFHAYAHLADRYVLLPHGASIGDRYGPIVVARGAPPSNVKAGLAGRRVAIPGKLTTAYLALTLCQPAVDPVVIPFDRIEDAVLAGDVEAGLLIHEGQITYADRGLHRWLDLGEWWHGETGLPLPLGGNVVRRDFGPALIGAISDDLMQSIRYGLAHRPAALAHAQRYARDLDPARTDRFVGMYVNAYTVDYGPKGRKAVQALLDRGADAGLVPRVKVEYAMAATSKEPA